MKVVVFVAMQQPSLDPPTSYYEKLKRSFLNVDWHIVRDPQVFLASLSDAEVLFAPLLNQHMLAAAPNLKWFHASSIQFGSLVEDTVFETKAAITNSRGCFTPIVTENVIGAMLFLAHRMNTARGLSEHERKPGAMALMKTHRLRGKTMGIVGLGANGRGIAAAAASLGMSVVATKRTPLKDTPKGVTAVLPPGELPAMLKQSAIVVITAPLTPETQNLIGAAEIAHLPEDAIIINAGKPEIVDEDAVAEALGSGALFGYGCDDMVASDGPVRRSERSNIVIFPHAGPGDRQFWSSIFGLFARNLKRYTQGQQLLNYMNRELKY